jgi:hypothetical protein
VKKKLLSLCLLGLLSCATDKKPELPPGLLPPEKLTSILADIHIAEAQLETVHLGVDTAKVVFEQMQLDILKKRGVSKKDFDKTYDYYLNKNLSALDKIYEGLVDTLGMREVKFSSMPATVPASQSESDVNKIK